MSKQYQAHRIMKGYYTVEVRGGDFALRDRMTVEARYAAALERLLGGLDVARAALLDAGEGRGDRAAVQAALNGAEREVWDGPAPEGVTFTVRAWSARDL